MSYDLDDETSEINAIKEKTRELEDQLFDLVTIGTENDGPPVSPTLGKVRQTDNTLGGTQGKTELGDVDGTINISFTEFDTRRIFGNVFGDLTLTFSQIPIPLLLALRLYIRVTNPTIIIAGTTIEETTEIDDFLDLQLESTDGINITITSVKKNDETAANVVPTVPQDVESTDEQKNSITIKWNPPGIGSLPILYDVSWSTSPAGDSVNGPTTPDTGAPITGIDALEQVVTGLITSTTYFFWVRGVNAAGNGDYFGPLQTVTEPSNTAGDVNFAIVATSFNTIQTSWEQPAGKQLQFTLIRDPGGNDERILASRVTTTEIIIDDRLEPLTIFSYLFQVFNEVGSLLTTINSNVQTDDLPLPVLTIVVNGRTLQFSIPIPAGINISRVNYSTDETFSSTRTQQLVKTVAKDTPQTVVFQTEDLSPNTLFFIQARFELNAHNGPFNAIQEETTDILPTPQKPEINTFTSSLTRGIVKFEVEFKDNLSVNESAILSFRDSASVGEFFPFGGNVLSRDFPPADDLDPTDEDEIRVVRAGGGFGAVATITVISGAITAFDITNGGQSFTSGQAISVYDDNDENNTGFEGTAIVNGSGQLTGVNITNGGDFWDNGATVEILGQIASGDPGFGVWIPGNEITIRVECANLTGTSEADSENVTPATS